MNTLKKIIFENYKCFERSDISFRDLTIIVGRNNAGKSTIIEALRLIALAGMKSKTAVYRDPPSFLGLPIIQKGFHVNVEKLRIELRGAIHYYDKDAVARITAIYKDKTKIILYIKDQKVFACVFDEQKNVIKKKAKAQGYNFDSISILPQIGLIKENEKPLTEDTIVADKETYLSSRHFRNELFLYKNDYFEEFKRLAESTWHGLRIDNLKFSTSEDEFIQLFLEDERFTAEIGLMGSGIQMWLQIIWFICRTKGNTTVVLDEPDVYMHPDLQRKILRVVKLRYPQVIIATHSVDIMSEVDSENIVEVDKNNRQMKYANNLKAVQNIVDNIGSAHNLSLIRINLNKKCLFVEGGDVKMLSKFHGILFPESDFSLEVVGFKFEFSVALPL